ncbi:hypothetical protein BTS2_4046 [Bacillus sp. TS-2]|nr:hypothetical protein BTS2_4046 [Bacillus sp. TS-2]
MLYEQLQRKRAKRLYIIGHILIVSFIVCIAIMIWTDIGDVGFWVNAILYLGMTGFSSYIGAAWMNYLAKQSADSVKFAELDFSTVKLLEMSRVMAMRETFWRYRIHFFTLTGNRIAFAEEQNNRRFRALLPIIRILQLRIWLPMDYQFYISETLSYTLKKETGLKPFILYDQNYQIIARLTYKWYEIIRLKLHIEDENGTKIALLDGEILGNYIRVIDEKDGGNWIEVKTGGVPLEAMARFPQGGNIIDIKQNLSEKNKLIAFSSIIAVHSFYDLQE